MCYFRKEEEEREKEGRTGEIGREEVKKEKEGRKQGREGKR